MEIAQKKIMCYTKQESSLLSKDTQIELIDIVNRGATKTDNSENMRLSSIEKAIYIT